jgi:transcriptional regulator with XRE-family HTH domain
MEALMQPDIPAAELGRHIAAVRERAGFKQVELAKKVTWSPAVLSRVESGERPLAAEELDMLLSGIGTEDADQLRRALQRQWRILPRPPLDHPDQEELWKAEQVAVELVARREDPSIRQVVERRLSGLLAELEATAALLLEREYRIAFMGQIGVGKSTAICRLTKLEVADEKGGPPSPVLEAGAGGITICEVHLRPGPGYGLIIEPRTDEEVRADVLDFAEYLTDAGGGDDDIPREQQGISKEIERAIRNMSGLGVRREKRPDGKFDRRDQAKELAAAVPNVRQLVVEILARMELHRRDRRDIWFDLTTGQNPLAWLKETFEKVNNGRHPEFTLPRRIEVVVPFPLVSGTDVSIRMIDSKGIDRTAARADLEAHLDDMHTLAVLCSSFNNAPSAEGRLVLERARGAGVRTLSTRAALLALPRNGEALAVKDDETGMRVESTEEGYELKAEQVALSLQPLGLADIPVAFFNAYEDSPDSLHRLLLERVRVMRDAFRNRLRAIAADAASLLENFEREQVQEVIRHAGTMLHTWIEQNRAVPQLPSHVQDSLMDEISRTYASTIRASVRREGEWVNLSYSHHLGYGSRRLAALALEPAVNGFAQICRTLQANPDYVEAASLIAQADRTLSNAYEELLRKVQLLGQTAFRQELKNDIAFWVECDSEWGQGPGYRNRIADRNNRWFSQERAQELETQLWSIIDKEWRDVLGGVGLLFEDDREE